VRFHQDWSPATTCVINRVVHHRGGCNRIVAVDREALKPIALGALEQRDLGLDFKRGGDGPVVVLDKEDHRCIKGSGKDHGFVNIAFGGGAVTEAGYGNATFFCPASVGPSALLLSDPPAVSDSVWDLGGQHNGVGLHVVVAGLPAGVDGTAEEIKNI